MDNSGRTREAMTSEIDRYCGTPGQACGYKVGHTEINRLRDKARAALGARYDLRVFDEALDRHPVRVAEFAEHARTKTVNGADGRPRQFVRQAGPVFFLRLVVGRFDHFHERSAEPLAELVGGLARERQGGNRHHGQPVPLVPAAGQDLHDPLDEDARLAAAGVGAHGQISAAVEGVPLAVAKAEEGAGFSHGGC